MKSYEDWAREVVTKTGTMGAKQVMLEMQRIIDSVEQGLKPKSDNTNKPNGSVV